MSLQLRDKANEILAIYRFYGCGSDLYNNDDSDTIDALFDAVVAAIDDCGILKPHLPYNEFVKPSRCVLEGDPGWVGHFEERDNRRFFLSDIYDFLVLFYAKR
jgi:hypothetical protein